MNERYSWYRGRTDVVIIPRIRVTFALSILIHVVALWIVLPRLPLLSAGQEREQSSDRLQVVLNAPPAPLPEPPPAPKAPVPPRETRAIITARPRPRNAPPRETPPEFVMPAPPPEPLPEPPKPQPQVGGDLASYVEARRRARGETGTSSSPEESENERRNRIVAASMPSAQGAMAGPERKRGGGLFEIMRMTYDDAEFHFYGFQKDLGRKAPQTVEVRLGNNSDMRIAVVRRMIELIRVTERGDITWESYRLGRNVVLSARPEDNAGLEEFMMHEFFDPAPGTRR